MIYYEPGKWSVAFAFSLKGSVFPKASAWAFPCSMLAGVIRFALNSSDEWRERAGSVGSETTSVLSGFAFILGFLVVFRSQQAYNRWWEGGTLLQQLRGEWFNSYSCLLAFCTNKEELQDDVRRFQHQMVRLFSILHGCALQQVSTLQEKRFEVLSLDGFDEGSFMFLQLCPDRCEVCLQWIQRLIVDSSKSGVIDIAPPILSRVFNELGNGIVNLSNARKITEFPIPFPMTQMITVMLLFHACITPIICATTVESPGYAAMVTFVVIFAYWSINYIALELEMPFGDDINDLPLHVMQQDMNRSLIMLMHRKAQGVPKFTYDEDKHELLAVDVVNFDGELLDYGDRSSAIKDAHDVTWSCEERLKAKPHNGVEFPAKQKDSKAQKYAQLSPRECTAPKVDSQSSPRWRSPTQGANGHDDTITLLLVDVPTTAGSPTAPSFADAPDSRGITPVSQTATGDAVATLGVSPELVGGRLLDRMGVGDVTPRIPAHEGSRPPIILSSASSRRKDRRKDSWSGALTSGTRDEQNSTNSSRSEKPDYL